MANGGVHDGIYPVSLALFHHIDDDLSPDTIHKENSGGIFTAHRCWMYFMLDAKSAHLESRRLMLRFHKQCAPESHPL